MGSAGITELFRAAAFDTETVERLCRAHEIATKLLGEQDRHRAVVNEAIADRIVRIAQDGERDPVKLARAALQSVGIGGDI